jgi:large subunit ribosomal protein L18
MNPQTAKQALRHRRQLRVRKRLRGTDERPRLAVFRSGKHTYAQVINDQSGTTLAAASTLEPDLRSTLPKGGNKSAAEIVGKTVAERARQQGITKVAFDRRHYRFHGRIAALANAARQAGLEF